MTNLLEKYIVLLPDIRVLIKNAFPDILKDFEIVYFETKAGGNTISTEKSIYYTNNVILWVIHSYKEGKEGKKYKKWIANIHCFPRTKHMNILML